MSIPFSELSQLLEGFCQSNQLAEAFDLASDMLKNNVRIYLRHFKFLMTKLAAAGEVDKLKSIEELIDAVSFNNF